MSKWAMIIDIPLCNNCNNCFIAVKDEHIANDFPGYSAPQPAHGARWLDMERKERGTFPAVEANFRPAMCNHCDDAPCVAAARDGAAKKRVDGIVLFDPVKSRGQRQIMEACPYGAVAWNEELDIPQIWTFDAHLRDKGWKQGRIEQACPTGALKSVKLSDAELADMVARDGLQVRHPEYGTRPRVFYKHMNLFTHELVVGAVVTQGAKGEECLAGASVRLLSAGQEIGHATSDTFGEFRIEIAPDIAPDSLTLQVEAGGVSREFACSASSFNLCGLDTK